MKKSLYYRAGFRPNTEAKVNIMSLLGGALSPFRLLLEVFIRKNFGERYFSSTIMIVTAFIFSLGPFYINLFARFFSSYPSFEQGNGSEFWKQYTLWYLFLLAFLFFSYLRRKEIKRNPSVFDFAKYSYYSGDINPVFYKLPGFSKRPTIRTVEIFCEPLPFFIVGLFLWIIGQKLGVLLFFSSIFYSISFSLAYKVGDNFVIDKIDEMIINEELEDTFVNGLEPEDTKGLRFYGRRPNSDELRRKISNSILEESKNEKITLAK